jgi:hypothetical protein
MRFMLSLALLLGARSTNAQRPVTIAPNAPVDRPVSARERCQWDSVMRAMAPYVERARATYPAAKARYLNGLPPRHAFFVTVRLTDAVGRNEQVFLFVDSIANGKIGGRIWSEIALVNGYKLRQPYEVAESDIVDWMVARPDGTEEGNVVGVFLDTYRPPASC